MCLRSFPLHCSYNIIGCRIHLELCTHLWWISQMLSMSVDTKSVFLLIKDKAFLHEPMVTLLIHTPKFSLSEIREWCCLGTSAPSDHRETYGDCPYTWYVSVIFNSFGSCLVGPYFLLTLMKVIPLRSLVELTTRLVIALFV